ncbi:MAG: deoxyribonuclease V [Deltaproteobacteria bacterium]|nr:MAG: deoxyribonuclease V [Deltaproteobacteria bacterium]
MRPLRAKRLHRWDVTIERALEIQKDLAKRILLRPLPQRIELVAGADMCYDRERELFVAAVVVLSFPQMGVVEEAWSVRDASFPYVPGLLSFREAPALVDAFEKLRNRPDVLMLDGQGLAHPRRLGLACHVGLLFGMPSVGCAKSRLVGTAREPGLRRGCKTLLYDKGEKVGVVLRTRDGVRPVYVSPGHLADLGTSARLVLRCSKGYRLPEPTRLADILAARVKRELAAGILATPD